MAEEKSIKQRRQERYGAKYWNSEISSSTERHKAFFDQAKESINVFTTKHKYLDSERRLNAWWFLVESLLPAYYSSTPKVEVNLRKNAGGTIYQIVSTGLERSTQYGLDEYFDFDNVGLGAARSFLLTGRACLWARYEADIEDKLIEVSVKQTETGLVDSYGAPYKISDDVELEETENGLIAKEYKKAKNEERAVLDLVSYHDYLESDARTEDEITWKARRAYMTEDQVESMFGGDMVKKLNFDAYPESATRDRYKNRSQYDGKAELWEIHCEESGKVYWFQAKGEKSIIESGDPALKFEGFYPCEVINATLSPDSTIPVSDYTHARDQILEVERLTSRIHSTIISIRTNALYDATMGKEVEDILKGDLRMIPVKNWPSYKGARGGLANGTEFLNIDPYIKALDTLVNSREQALQKLYEIMKCSELLRGTSDPRKTATANRLENQWSSMQLVVRQNQFAKFISKSIAKVGAIIAQQFSDERLIEIGDVSSLIGQVVAGSPEAQDPMMAEQLMQSLTAQYLEICRNNIERCYRIEISSDSMVAIDEAQERKDAADLMTSAGGFFDQMKSMVEQYPSLAPFAVELFKFTIRRYKGGKELEPIFTTAIQSVSKLAQVKEQQAAQTPPDPKMMEIQGRMQIAQMESQSKIELAKLNSQDQQNKTMAEVQQSAAEVQIDRMRAEVESFKAQQEAISKQRELEIKANQVQVDILKIQAETNVDMSNLKIIDENNKLQALLQTQAQDLERTKLQVQSTLEQIRLLHEKVASTEAKANEAVKPRPEGSKMPKIEIHNHPAKPSKRVGKFMPDGSVELSDISDDAEPTDLDPGRPKA